MQNHSIETTYNAAMVLNNSAISLLERGDTRQAREIFMQAIHLMHTVTKCAQDGHYHHLPSDETIQYTIQSAQQRLSQHSSAPRHHVVHVVHQADLAEVVSSDRTDKLQILVRMERSWSSDDWESCSDMDSAILLYNTAVAMVLSHPLLAPDNARGAFAFLKMAGVILTRTEFDDSDSLALALLVFEHLARLACLLDLVHAEKDCREFLIMLYQEFMKHGGMVQMFASSAVTAAAA